MAHAAVRQSPNLMKLITTPSVLTRLTMCVLLFCALRVHADVVETSNGAREVGKITGIEKGVIKLETEYAGKIEVKQSLVTRITTDRPVAVRLADGSKVVGVVSSPAADKIRVTGPDKTVDASVSNLAAWWAAGEEDPDVVAKRRKWSYEAGVDINGRSGTESQLGTAYHYRAKLVGPDDTFQYYTAYTRQESEDQVSANQFKAGVDYADNFSQDESWYVRDEGGFDRVNFITLYDIAAGGYGYDFINQKDQQMLTGRIGLSYRYDQYGADKGPALSSAGADFGLEYMVKIKKSQLSDKISFDPAFSDLGNFVINHEFAFDVPLTKSLWKLSSGVSNTYYSKPVSDVSKMETLFFTRLVLTWGAQPN